MRTVSIVTWWFLVLAAGPAWAQLDGPSSVGIRFGEEKISRWKVGITMNPAGAPCARVFGTTPVPTDWPEQRVRIVEEDISPVVREVKYRVLENGVKQMLISIPLINPGETAKALVTFEVAKKTILPPEDPSQFDLPKKMLDVSMYLKASPMIETDNPRIRKLAREIVQEKVTAWEKVEAIYDWVRDHIEYRDGPLKGAAAALRDGNGDCEELTSLFIALCRVNRIPARTVWIPQHCYPEFYLQDKQGKGHWIPCQVAGTREFGGMSDSRPILQKGDNFRVPEKKGPQRYVAEFLTGVYGGKGEPDHTFVRQLLPGS
mgnify:CR=1 FL=1